MSYKMAGVEKLNLTSQRLHRDDRTCPVQTHQSFPCLLELQASQDKGKNKLFIFDPQELTSQ
jgi:hypothetical protein